MQTPCSISGCLVGLPGLKYRSVVALRSGHLGVLAVVPNRSIKRTCLRQAAYVER